MANHDEVLERCAVEGVSCAGRVRERVAEAYAPLVYSVCRRYLRRREDVEDAAQETFLKLTRHAGGLRCGGSVTSWLGATAASTSLDMIRRAAREGRRVRAAARMAEAAGGDDMPHDVLHRRIGALLVAALGEVDEAKRELVVERFVRKTPMRVLAGRLGVTPSAVSRRVSGALAELAAVLRGMGVRSADELTLAEHFGDPAHLDGVASSATDPLRFAPDWRELSACARPPGLGCLPGWTRPLRVGVLVSYLSTIAIGTNGPWPADLQLLTTRFVSREGIDLVSVIEPESAARGPVERAMREYGLVGGLIDASDAESLRTLDVIQVGWNITIDGRLARALYDAVSSGVGLLNEFWTGKAEETRGCHEAHSLMLSRSYIHGHHSIPHGQATWGHMVGSHPLLPGLAPGMRVPANGCSPVFAPAPGARVLAVSDAVVPESEHGIAGLGTVPMPLIVAGTVGRGRVWAVNTFPHHRIGPHLSVPMGEYLRGVLAWLGEPRRE